MFDFHSHILPCMDDGSRSVEESAEILYESSRQGITGIAATPHFYADTMTPDSFLKKRKCSFDMLKPYIKSDLPAIRLGAEVHYFDGIISSDDMLKLRIEGTSLLLVEMPLVRWTSHMCDTLSILNSHKEITVILAHIERYVPFQKTDIIYTLQRQGILMQASADFFINRRYRRKAFGMMRNGMIDVLGSDCHNIKERPQNLGMAVKAIREALGEKYIDILLETENELLK